MSRILVNTTAYLATVLVAVGLVVYAQSRIAVTARLAGAGPMLLPPEHLERFTFGYNDVVADSLWIRSIQSFDFCGNRFYSGETGQIGANVFKVCREGWVYHMLDAATRVSPRYKIIYTRGAIGLSVIVNDRDGANKLFDRGEATIPDDWAIHYMSGYHKLIEMNDPAAAAESMRLAGATGAPNWVPLLAARLYDQAGRAEIGLRALAQFYGDTDFADWPARAQERWRELEKNIGRKVDPRTLLNGAGE